jgi:hypothetical protein
MIGSTSPPLDDSFENCGLLLIPFRYASGSLPASHLCAPMHESMYVLSPLMYLSFRPFEKHQHQTSLDMPHSKLSSVGNGTVC